MRIVVVGGTGHIGSRLVTALQDCNQDVVVASPLLGCQHDHRRGVG